MKTDNTEQKRQVAKVRLLEAFNLGKNTGKRAGAEITVFGKDGKPQLGTMKIGSGSFDWWARKAKKPSLHLSWYEFADLMKKEQKRRRGEGSTV
jgi:hypothetical protein